MEELYERFRNDPSVSRIIDHITSVQNIRFAAAVNGTTCGSSATQHQAAEQGAGVAVESCPQFSFSVPSLSIEDARKEFCRDQIVICKREAYVFLRGLIQSKMRKVVTDLQQYDESLLTSFSVRAEHEDMKAEAETGAPERRIPALSGLEADGITEEEVIAYEKGDLQALLRIWADQWTRVDDDEYALGKPVRLLLKRTRLLAKVQAHENNYEEVATHRDAVTGIVKLARAWRRKAARRVAQYCDPAASEQGARMKHALLEGAVGVYGRLQQLGMKVRKSKNKHPVAHGLDG